MSHSREILLKPPDQAPAQESGEYGPEVFKNGVAGPRIFLFGVGREKIQLASDNTRVPVDLVRDLHFADVVLTTKTHYKRGVQLIRTAEQKGKPVYVLRKNTLPQAEHFLRTIAKEQDQGSQLEDALMEAQEAAELVLNGAKSVELSPQRAYIRRLQHLLAERYHVSSTSSGRDPQRRVAIFRR